MKLSAAANANVTIDVGDETISVPLYPMQAVVDWCGELDARRREDFERRADRLIEDPEKRWHYLNTYAPFPADEWDVQTLAVGTPAGTLRVAAACLGRAVVTARAGAPLAAPEPLAADRAEAIVAANRVAGLRPLVRQLVGLPPEAPRPKPAGKDETSADPLPGSSGGSPSTPPTGSGEPAATGEPTSHSSSPLTPDSASTASASPSS